MTWIATLAGDAEQLGADEARKAETAVRDALQSIADGLAGAGHVGIKAEFHGSQLGQLNLLQPADPTAQAAGVEMAPGTAAAPTMVDTPPAADASDQVAPDAPPAALPEQSAAADPAPQATA